MPSLRWTGSIGLALCWTLHVHGQAPPATATEPEPGANVPAPAPNVPAPSTPTTASASPAPTPTRATPAPTPRQVLVAREKAAKEKLVSSDPEAIRVAIDALVEIGGESAAKAISERLHQGLPPQLMEQAIDALVMLNRTSVGPVLLELTLHRRAPLRERAVTAIGALKIRSAQSALLYCLDDPNSDVRAAAIAALGDVGDQRALSALWSAADHGAPTALAAIGKIVRPANAAAILERVKDGDVLAVRPVLQVMMERTDYPVSAKVDLVTRLAKLGSPAARTLLMQWLDAWKVSAPAPLRQALFNAIKRLDSATAAPASTGAPATAQPAPSPPANVAPAPPSAPATPAPAEVTP